MPYEQFLNSTIVDINSAALLMNVLDMDGHFIGTSATVKNFIISEAELQPTEFLIKGSSLTNHYDVLFNESFKNGDIWKVSAQLHALHRKSLIILGLCFQGKILYENVEFKNEILNWYIRPRGIYRFDVERFSLSVYRVGYSTESILAKMLIRQLVQLNENSQYLRDLLLNASITSYDFPNPITPSHEISLQDYVTLTFRAGYIGLNIFF
jgi:hypothetical protein